MAQPLVQPIRDPVVDRKSFLVVPTWQRFFNNLLTLLLSCAAMTGSTSVATQSASIAATAISTAALAAGVYRVTWGAVITHAATVSSSLTVTIAWTFEGVARSKAFPAITGNTLATADSGTVLIEIDDDTDVTYATTYASAGATPMQYDLNVMLETTPV